MSDRICTITHDLSGIRLRCDSTGTELSWPTPIDVAHAFALERYRRLDLLAQVEAARNLVRKANQPGQTLNFDELLIILSGP